MKWLKILGLTIVMSFGVFMVIYGETDDSPGGQLLGVVLFLGGTWSMWTLFRRQKN